MQRHKLLEFYIVFGHHSVVRMPDGTLQCPSTRKGDGIGCIEDPLRPFDYQRRTPYNLGVFANHRVSGAQL